MDDDEFESEELVASFEELPVPSYRWSKQMVEADALRFAAKISEAAFWYLDTMASRAASENNFAEDLADAQNEARTQIDAITKPEQEG